MSKITSREQIENLPLKKSRKTVKEGDLFAIKISENFYILGQIIVSDIKSYDKAIDCLIVFYKIKAKELYSFENITSLENIELLTEKPFLVNKNLWSKGCLQNIGHLNIPETVCPFYFNSLLKNGIVDVYGELINKNNITNKTDLHYELAYLYGIISSIRKVYDQEPNWFSF